MFDVSFDWTPVDPTKLSPFEAIRTVFNLEYDFICPCNLAGNNALSISYISHSVNYISVLPTPKGDLNQNPYLNDPIVLSGIAIDDIKEGQNFTYPNKIFVNSDLYNYIGKSFIPVQSDFIYPEPGSPISNLSDLVTLQLMVMPHPWWDGFDDLEVCFTVTLLFQFCGKSASLTCHGNFKVGGFNNISVSYNNVSLRSPVYYSDRWTQVFSVSKCVVSGVDLEEDGTDPGNYLTTDWDRLNNQTIIFN